MSRAKLTKTLVEGAPVGPTDAYVWDTALPRFGLRVTKDGSRIYLVQYRERLAEGGSRTRRVSIGKHGRPWTIEAAREEAKRLLASSDLGVDPFRQRQAGRASRAVEKAAATRKQEREFAAVVDRYVALRLKHNRSGEETARLLRFDAVPHWQGRSVEDISRADVVALLDQIRPRSEAVCRSTFAALRGFFGWCAERELVEVSPCLGVRAPPRMAPRERVLTDPELSTIWKACDELGYPFGPLFQLLILTGQRRGEVAGMTWGELDLPAALWRLPRERTKNGRAHQVDLSDEAMALIKTLPRVGEHVFPAREAGPARGFSATKRKLDTIVSRLWAQVSQDPLREWRLHDFRRTAATGMAALGHQPHVIERVINHASGVQGGLIGVYQRHEYRSERKEALADWGRHVAALVSGAPESVRAANLVLASSP